MAMLLITGKVCVAKRQNSEEILSLNDISEIITFETAEAVLRCRLFLGDARTNPEPEFLFFPMHRTVAEFLSAQWLAHEVESKDKPEQVTRRLTGLLSAEGGFPASLRGLLAWLPKFSPELLNYWVQK